ncbi:MAG: hypothetical protein EZS28_000009 [Streblomastix strix]|uniref:Uncharacterized protein n=1 Tax=Streblomastix strix TaxID=222440 RepID=A0A5J4XB13_9EUKA|nr:MAG: hypothetical protein EZS28_000009 [Streblomastix strix]
MFRNWSPIFQFTKQFTQLGSTADLIAGLHTEPLTESGLKNLVRDVRPVTTHIKNCVIIKVTANMASYKATDACLNRVRQFYSQRPFVVPAEKDVRATTCFENPCYQNMQVTTCSNNFPDMPMNTLDQQFFQLQIKASNLDLSIEATEEFEDALTTPRNTATRRLNPHTELINFLITLQYERNSNGALTFDGLDTQNQNTSIDLRGVPIYQGATNSYYNVDTRGKRPSSPIL